MRKLLQKKSGFTLIELMIVVAILGILAAVAIPAFATYLRRSKTGEAYENLEALFKGVSAYYNKEFVASAAINASTFSHCAVTDHSDGITPSDVKQDGTHANWVENGGIGFDPGMRYYSIGADNGFSGLDGNGCAGDANNLAYVMYAYGNLDNDASISTFSLASATSGSNEIYKAGQMYVNNELE